MLLVALLAAFDEFGGKVLITVGAGDGALVAQRIARAGTVCPLIVTDGRSTGRAGEAVPFAEGDIGAAGVIGVQDLRNDLEEIVKPTFAECSANRENALAFAKAVVPDMRMRHVLITGGRPA